jgi:hypothetical protein
MMEKTVREDLELLMLHATTALNAGHRVSVGRTGVAELIEIDKIAIVPSTDLIIIQPKMARAGHPQLWAEGQWAVLEIVENVGASSE